MPTAADAEPDAPSDESDLSRSYLAVVTIEVIVLVGLFWLGRHFG